VVLSLGCEDPYVGTLGALTSPTCRDRNREVASHVLDGDAVLMEKRPCDPLADLLLRAILDRLTGYLVDDLIVSK
jgi:hypothetical protein